ncbi:arsinothricin resistance N-acetyltransferase ArsN1 family B [Microbulbifer marinus]|uniref:Phosphinothricin acetyltransferase n=1 Tax=Microbulbifer marinus TaxID=658218 RepID=A0A1H3VTC0_9GAMM|nr:arsinothricin resistance N-acetyltransferase ArsN1 family B [Microbulbifer marinus]SDZ77474.1 phosphinothricin acetyltransferase [Microbulbifer marinus]
MIRFAQPDDAEQIADIYNHYIRNTVATFETEPVSGSEMAGRITDVAANGLPWLVAEGESGISGYAYATPWRSRAAYRRSVEASVYLHTDARGRGLGSILYRALFDELKQRSIHAVICGIALPNTASVALHEKFGMEKVAHFKEVGFKFDRWIDVGYWQCLLEPDAF